MDTIALPEAGLGERATLDLLAPMVLAGARRLSVGLEEVADGAVARRDDAVGPRFRALHVAPTVEVLGPPELKVAVRHPSVVGENNDVLLGQVYDLQVEIENVSSRPFLMR